MHVSSVRQGLAEFSGSDAGDEVTGRGKNPVRNDAGGAQRGGVTDRRKPETSGNGNGQHYRAAENRKVETPGGGGGNGGGGGSVQRGGVAESKKPESSVRRVPGNSRAETDDGGARHRAAGDVNNTSGRRMNKPDSDKMTTNDTYAPEKSRSGVRGDLCRNRRHVLSRRKMPAMKSRRNGLRTTLLHPFLRNWIRDLLQQQKLKIKLLFLQHCIKAIMI